MHRYSKAKIYLFKLNNKLDNLNKNQMYNRLVIYSKFFVIHRFLRKYSQSRNYFLTTAKKCFKKFFLLDFMTKAFDFSKFLHFLKLSRIFSPCIVSFKKKLN